MGEPRRVAGDTKRAEDDTVSFTSTQQTGLVTVWFRVLELELIHQIRTKNELNENRMRN